MNLGYFIKKLKIQCGLIILVCFICYGQYLNGEFVFDDSVAIVKNNDVVSKNNNSVFDIFEHDFWGYNISTADSHKSYRPITTLTFRLEHNIYGLNSKHMKIVNLFLHCGICCYLLRLFNKLFIKYLSQMNIFFAILLFTVHPIHTEAVAGIVGRAELLTTIVYLLAIEIFTDSVKNSREMYSIRSILKYFILTFLTMIGILCKETGIMIMPICIAYDVVSNLNVSNILQMKTCNFQFKRDVLIRSIILLFTTFLLLYCRLWIVNFEQPKFKDMDNPLAASSSFTTRGLTQSFLYSLNLWLLLCPDWLSFDWALGSIDLVEKFTDIRIFSIILFYLFLTTTIINGSKSTHLALVLMILPFVPASGIIKLGFVIAERILYIPSIGFCFLVILGFNMLNNSLPYFKSVWYLFFGVTIVTMIFKTRMRAHEWINEELLFRSAIRVCPNNAKIYYNIARLATDKNDKDSAFKYYHKAISLHPKYESALMNLGNLYREQKNLEKAEYYLKRSTEVLEEFPAAWMNLGIVQASKGEHMDALESYNKALKYRKRYATCYYNLGILYLEMKNISMALKYWNESIAINPYNSKAWANILALMDNNGLNEDVINLSTKALAILPNDPAILFTRANAFGKLNMFTESEEIFKQIIKLRPTYSLYYVNLGVLYHRWNKKSSAINMYQEALKIDPTLKSARGNLLKLQNKHEHMQS